ncbi:CDP-glucose 4,6-dehydratase [Luminiphilus sp.]|nr:CDP-glucose 4,6-dehydratase [Luminiphilus sp.]
MQDFWDGRSVFLTGHTGFKGGWLALWLGELGAEVYGYALDPPSSPSFYNTTRVADRLQASTIADIRDFCGLACAMKQASPSVVFHMAAQSLVRDSYIRPVDTYSTNVQGTVNVLEACRQTESVRAVVNITTDKCYENREWVWPYREHDRLGGEDPYSSSKACAELVAAAYDKSFYSEANIHLANVRAGNVIGGGDWAKDRLIPDFMRAFDSGETLFIRSPTATRPWQHVLEPLSGYLKLAERLVMDRNQFSGAWNFGPDDSDSATVAHVLQHLQNKAPQLRWQSASATNLSEANTLKLDSAKAKTNLGWKPRWSLDIALDKTIEWYQAWREDQPMTEFSIEQIRAYQAP